MSGGGTLLVLPFLLGSLGLGFTSLVGTISVWVKATGGKSMETVGSCPPAFSFVAGWAPTVFPVFPNNGDV